MKKFFCFLFSFMLIIPLVLFGCGQTQTGDPTVDMSVRRVATESTASLSDMLSQAKSAVVGISVDLADGYAIGSGFAISDGGLILTNNHVVEGGSNITLYYADKTTGTGEVLWTDPGLDMAVVRSSREIPYLGVNTGEVYVGQEVFALGTPLTLEFKHTVTHGIISATNRTLETQSGSGVSFLQSLIQHDAAINPGNSGGPLINSAGQVIGINTLKATEGEGIGFAIPIEIGSIVTEQIKENQNYQSPYLGVFGFDSDIALAYGEKLNADGVYVISTDGPAKQAGLQKGDLITKVGGVEVKNLLDLRKAVFSYNQGDALIINFYRNGTLQEAMATLQ